jgi:hypothetical protein
MPMGLLPKPAKAKFVVLAATTVMAFLPAASASADLTISQTASPSFVKPGGLVTITVTVHNNGPGEANGDVELFSLSPEAGGR